MLKKLFIPNLGNDHKPLFLRRKAVLFTLCAVLILEGLFLVEIFLIFPNSGLLSSILPNVLVDLVNINRQTDNLGVLKVNPLLEQAARLKAEDMARNNYFDHTGPDGTIPWFWLEKVGYKFIAAGENLAVNFSDSNDVDTAWMNSLGHRANILNEDFTEIGIGTAPGVWKGRETVFVVQFFGRPVPQTIQRGESAEEERVLTLAAVKNTSEPEKSENENQAIVDLAGGPKEPKPEDAVLAAPASGNFIRIGEVSGLAGSDTVSGQENHPSQSTIVQRLASMPRSLVDTVYVILTAIVLLALGLKIFVKVGIQYPALIFNGIILLFCVISILYLNFLLFGDGAVF